MKTNKKKRLTVSLLAIVTVLALVLTGCGAENAAEHNKYLKDEVLNSQTVDKETSSADKEDKSDKDKTSASEADKDSSKSDDKKDSDKSDNKNTGSSSSNSSSSSSSSSKKPSTGSGSGSTESNKPSTGGSSSDSNKPSGGGSSSSGGNKPSTGGGNSGSSSKPTEPTNPPTEPSKPAHKHNWVTDYKTVHHEAEYRYDPVYEEQITGYNYWYECKKCGAKFDNDVDCGEHCVFECNSTYTYKEDPIIEKVQVDTEQVLVKEAWEEKIPIGQHCTGCNATK